MKKIALNYQGKSDQVGILNVLRSLPNRYVDSVGPFVFLDQLPYTEFDTAHLQRELDRIKGKTAHPHAGIATFSYVMNGIVEHYDSAGNQGRVESGGMQWMKAGKGIIHDEIIIASEGNVTSPQMGMQFWIDLPADQKESETDYVAVQAANVPRRTFDKGQVELRVLIGEFKGLRSVIPTFTSSFMYHLILAPGSSYQLELAGGVEAAAVSARGQATMNEEPLTENSMMVFENERGSLKIENETDKTVELLLFGGEAYTDPIVFGGPFVGNSQEQVERYNTSYRSGQFGNINYKFEE